MEKKYIDRLKNVKYHHCVSFDEVLNILDDFIRETGSDQLAEAFSNAINISMEYDGYIKVR